MTAKAIELVWWIVGTFGVAGLVAFWFLAPAAAQLTLKIVVRFFKLLLGYRVGCALLAAIAAGLIVDNKRHAYDDEMFAKRTALFEEAQRRRDDTIAQATRDKVWAEIGEATAENKAIDNDVKEFSDVLPPPVATGNPFLIRDADAERLCKLAGQTQCEPDGDKGMPKAGRPGRHSADSKIRLPSLIRPGIGPDKKGQ